MSAESGLLGKGHSFVEANGNEKIDPQEIIRFGYKNCTRRIYLIRFDWDTSNSSECAQKSFLEHGVIHLDLRDIKAVIKDLMRLSTSSAKASSPFSIAVDFGFTFSGLRKLEIASDVLDVFRRKAPAFAGGASVRAQHHLGDMGLSDVQNWDGIYQDDSMDGGVHLALIAHFSWSMDGESADIPTENKKSVLVFEKKLLCAALQIKAAILKHETPLKGQWIEIAAPISTKGYEHFGYRDGVTAPAYQFKPSQSQGEALHNAHALGEILLGHPRNDGDNLFGELGIPFKATTNIDLQPLPLEDGALAFFKNSSFAALRKIEQDVEEFNAWIERNTKNSFLNDQQMPSLTPSKDEYESSRIWIKSKMLGRTPNGKLLKPDMGFFAVKDNAEVDKCEEKLGFKRASNNDGQASQDDSEGLGCPFSSHIRRMNPRDDSVTPFIHRPVLRRGMTYTQGESKGLLGLFFCADLVEQFEHLVGIWAQGRVMGIADDSNCRDPLIGNHEPQNNQFVLQSHDEKPPRQITLEFDKPFVRTRGCSYLWFPSLSTLANFSDYFDKLAYAKKRRQ